MGERANVHNNSPFQETSDQPRTGCGLWKDVTAAETPHGASLQSEGRAVTTNRQPVAWEAFAITDGNPERTSGTSY
jgi:hypothetical protein